MPKIKELASRKDIRILVLLIIAGALLFFGLAGREKAPIAQEQKECLPLFGTGKQTYDILTDKPNKLQITQVSVDPIDVREGETQKIMVKVKDVGNDTITNKSGVSAKILTDNGNAPAEFKLAKAEDEEDELGTSLATWWEGYWTKEDTTCHTYMETITATNDTGEEHFVDLSFK